MIVEPTEGKTFVSWGTPKLKAALEATAWPRVYRERTEIQENGCKRMIDEIGRWAMLEDPERQAIIDQLPGRKL